MANQCCDRRHWSVKTCISILLKLKLNEAKCIIIHKYANNPTLQTGDKCFTCFVFLSSGSLLTQLKLCLGRTVTTTPIITEELPLGHYCNNNPSHSLLCCRSPLSHHTTSSLCTKKKGKKTHTTVRRHYLLRAPVTKEPWIRARSCCGFESQDAFSHVWRCRLEKHRIPLEQCVHPHSDPSFFIFLRCFLAPRWERAFLAVRV